jgi:hypothetical protein
MRRALPNRRAFLRQDAEEPVEGLPGRQMADRRKLEPIERHMGAGEIDSGDPARIGNEIGEDVAATGRNRHHVALRRERQCCHVHIGIFPNLRIDQPLERQGEQDFAKAVRGKCPVAADRLVEAAACRCSCARRQSTLQFCGEPPSRARQVSIRPIGQRLGPTRHVEMMTVLSPPRNRVYAGFGPPIK